MGSFLRRFWNIFTIMLLGLGGLWIWVSRADPASVSANQKPAPQQGFPAPDFTLQTLSGSEITLSEIQGPVLINLWASWCAPCRAEMPDIQEVYDLYKDDGFVVLAVNATNQDRRDDVEDFVEDHDLTFPILLDTAGEVGRLYNLRSLPTSYFIDRQGVIRKVVIGGPMRVPTIEEAIKPLLKGGN